MWKSPFRGDRDSTLKRSRTHSELFRAAFCAANMRTYWCFSCWQQFITWDFKFKRNSPRCFMLLFFQSVNFICRLLKRRGLFRIPYQVIHELRTYVTWKVVLRYSLSNTSPKSIRFWFIHHPSCLIENVAMISRCGASMPTMDSIHSACLPFPSN